MTPWQSSCAAHAECCSRAGAGRQVSEDVLYCRETPQICFYGLADGQTGKSFCACGGRAVLQSMARYMERSGVSALCRAPFADELQYAFVRLIRRTISELARQHGAEETEFSSTAAVFALDPRTGEYMTVHLGDGAVIGVERDGALRLLSPPENGITLRCTWLTTSRDALTHIRIGRGDALRYRRVMLVSDGTVSVCRGKTLTRRAQSLLRDGSREELLRLAAGQETEDDACAVVIDLERLPAAREKN